MTRRRQGFALIELLMVLLVLSIVVGIAVPKYRGLRDRAVAAEVIGAITTVRSGAFAHLEATGHWPAGAATGAVPPELGPYLPDGFRFNQTGYALAWRSSSWAGDGGEASAQLVQVTTEDPFVCDAVNSLLGGSGNAGLVAVCNGTSGMVTLYVDN
jgi:prepilin-type N-terminal cleavage/methylation domain-containing protein